MIQKADEVAVRGMDTSVRARAAWLWGFWRKFPGVLALIIGVTVLHAMVVMVPPRVIKMFIDQIEAGIGNRQILIFTGVLVGLGLAQFATYVVLQTVRAKMNLTFEWRFRQHGFEELVRLSPRFYGSYRTGDLVTRLTDDVAQKLSWFSCSGIFRTFEAGSKLVVGVTAMLLLSVKLTLMTVVPLPLIILIFVYTRKYLQSRFDARQKSISICSDHIESGFAGIRVVKAYRHAAKMAREFADLVTRRKKAEVTAIKAEVLIIALWLQTWQIAMVLCLLSGGWLMTKGEVTFGTVFGMMGYVTLLVWPMFDFGQFFVASMRAAVSMDRLRELEHEPPEVTDPDDPVRIEAPRGELAFREVTVQLGETTALSDIAFDVPAGKRVAVVGSIGAGKSVLARLIPRLIDPDDGRVELDGVPIDRLSLDQLRQVVGYVPQDPILFSGTIEDNIRAARESITIEEIEWACRVACLERDLAEFPERLETIVGARGITLSGGQKQRVSLARALVGKPKLLVLDDCTASLDASTEAALWDELDRALPGMTCLLITHRTATLETADHIVVLDDGKVAEEGSHRTLIHAGGEYEMLYRRRRLEEAVGHQRSSSGTGWRTLP